MIHYNQPRQTALEEQPEEDEITIANNNEKPISFQNKQERVTCLKCGKPAVRYSIPEETMLGTKYRIVYEHRDEPPVGSYQYARKTAKGTRQNSRTVFKYRRCYGGVSVNGADVMEEIATETEIPQVQAEEREEEEEPPASDTIADVDVPYESVKPQSQSSQSEPLSKRSQAQLNKIHYEKPLPGHHHATGQELYNMVRAVRNEQRNIYRELNKISSLMEMYLKGDLVLAQKPREDKGSGVG